MRKFIPGENRSTISALEAVIYCIKMRINRLGVKLNLYLSELEID